MKKNTKKKGFTIVELVIVIAVIAILAAVLIPTFGNMIQKANDSKALQEARNDFTSYMIEHATEGNDDFVIQGGDYFFAVKNGVLDAENKYGTAEEAQNAVDSGATWVLSDADLGVYIIQGAASGNGGNAGGNEGAGEGSDDDDSSIPPVQPVVYSLLDEQLVDAMKTKTDIQRGRGVGSVMWSTSTMSNLSGKTVTKIAAQFAVTDNTKDCTLTVYVVSTDGKTKVREETITVDGTKFAAANITEWFEIDNLNIKLEEGQTISIGAKDDNTDTVKLGYVTTSIIAGGSVWNAGTGNARHQTDYTSLFNVWYVD